MDSLQEAFINAPELCEAHFIMDARTSFGLLNKNTHRNDNAWNSQDNF